MKYGLNMRYAEPRRKLLEKYKIEQGRRWLKSEARMKIGQLIERPLEGAQHACA